MTIQQVSTGDSSIKGNVIKNKCSGNETAHFHLRRRPGCWDTEQRSSRGDFTLSTVRPPQSAFPCCVSSGGGHSWRHRHWENRLMIKIRCRRVYISQERAVLKYYCCETMMRTNTRHADADVFGNTVSGRDFMPVFRILTSLPRFICCDRAQSLTCKLQCAPLRPRIHSSKTQNLYHVSGFCSGQELILNAEG